MSRMNKMEFFKLCEELRNKQEVLLNETPTLLNAAKMMTKLLGFNVTDNQIRDAQEATGVTWSSKRKSPCGQAERSVRLHTVVRSVVRLYRKLGEEVPSDLLALYDKGQCNGVNHSLTNGEVSHV